jgi:hypothetical protein
MDEQMPALQVLRYVGGVLIDHPLIDHAGPQWAGTLEPDRAEPSGWRRTSWAAGPGGRGWLVATLHVGDVVEFGSFDEPSHRWFGWHAHYSADNGAIVLCGPYPTPGEALVDGSEARAELTNRALDEYRSARLEHALADVPDLFEAVRPR